VSVFTKLLFRDHGRDFSWPFWDRNLWLIFKIQNLKIPASEIQLVRTSSIMRVGMSWNPNWSKNISNFPNHLRILLSDYSGMAKWFGTHYNQEVRFSSAVKCKKGSLVLTSLLNKRRNYYYKMDFLGRWKILLLLGRIILCAPLAMEELGRRQNEDDNRRDAWSHSNEKQGGTENSNRKTCRIFLQLASN